METKNSLLALSRSGSESEPNPRNFPCPLAQALGTAEDAGMHRRALLSLLAGAGPARLGAQAPVAEVTPVGYEKPEVLSAREWWGDASWLRGDFWRVRDEVRTDDFTNHYVVDSIYGTMEAWSDQHLLARIREIIATRRLREQSALRTSRDGLVGLAAEKLDVVEEIVASPVTTVFDVPRGARAIVRRTGSLRLEARRKGSYGEGGLLRDFVGATDRKRAVAARLEVDPYSDNEALQSELERVALLEALPEFSLGFVLPDNGLYSLFTTGREARMQDVFLASPSDLFVENRDVLRGELGVPEDLASAFLSLPFSTPPQQTILIRSLAAMSGARDRHLLIRLAVETTTRHQFDFFRRSAELLAWWHLHRTPVASLETFRWLPVAVSASRKRILPFAVDLGGWCQDCGSILSSFAEDELGDVVLVTGRLTERAHAELARRGMEVVEPRKAA